MKKFISITELSEILKIKNNYKNSNHVLRYWEKQFKQITPKKINNRRYYSPEQVETVKMIKFLLKNKGMTINGVKNLLNSNINKLDGSNNDSLKITFLKHIFKNKSKKILDKIKRIRKHGKKNSS
tara:strand:+ start:2635 stop:3009 length:375 start_codon:yes stop_codon:yes gene_type:complete